VSNLLLPPPTVADNSGKETLSSGNQPTSFNASSGNQPGSLQEPGRLSLPKGILEESFNPAEVGKKPEGKLLDSFEKAKTMNNPRNPSVKEPLDSNKQSFVSHPPRIHISDLNPFKTINSLEERKKEV